MKFYFRFSGVILLLFPLFFYAQQLPPSVQWRVMETPQLKIVYPAHLENYALKTARFVDSIYPHNLFPFHRANRIPLVLNPYTSVSNGYVTLVPRKSEWYLQPYYSSYFGNLEWYKALGIHEMRHVIQIDGINRETIKFYKIFAGNFAQLFLSFWAYPMWFFEGDAVYMETRLSQAGRGRSEMFKMPMRMMAGEYRKKDLNYYKIYFGSYNRYYPSHYHLGYYLMDYLYARYPDAAFWDALYTQTSRYAFIPGMFQLQLNYRTGLNYRRLTDSVFVAIKQRLPAPPPEIPALPLPRPKSYTLDKYPRVLPSGKWLFLRYGFDETPAIWSFDPSTGQTKKRVSIPSGHYSANGHYMAWTEFKTHPRWQNQTYVRVAVHDLQNGKTFYLTPADKYLYASVDVAPRDDRLAVVRYDLSLVPHLEIWDLAARKKVADYAYPQFESIRQPAFNQSGDKVVFSALTENRGSAIYSQPVNTPEKPAKLTGDFITENIYYPQLHGQYLYYQSGRGGLHIARRDLISGETDVLIRERYGMDGYTLSGDSICWSGYSAQGFRLKCRSLKKLSPEKTIPPASDSLVSFATGKMTLDHPLSRQIPARYPQKKFNRLASYLNLHSWLWGITAEDDSTYVAGAAVFMNDILDENSFMGGIIFNTRHHFQSFVRWEYKRYFPVFGIRYDADRYFSHSKPFYNFTGYIRIPLNFSSGIWNRSFQFMPFATYSSYGENNFYPYGLSLSYGVFRQRAYRHVSSRLGFSVQGTYRAEPISISEGKNLQTLLHLPGPGKNDHFALQTLWHRHSGVYPFYLNIPPVRGAALSDEKHWFAVQSTYHAPLFYPDWGWRRVFNVKRIRYKLFYDRAWTAAGQWQSYGGQLIGDWNFFGLKVDVPLGIQAAYVRPVNKWVISAVFMGITW